VQGDWDDCGRLASAKYKRLRNGQLRQKWVGPGTLGESDLARVYQDRVRPESDLPDAHGKVSAAANTRCSRIALSNSEFGAPLFREEKGPRSLS